MRTLSIRLLGAGLVACTAMLAQSPAIVSPEVHPDKRVTFRYRAPNAKEVMMSLEGAQRAAMQKDESGVWSITTAALEPDLYGYSFVVDGVTVMDPSNSLIKTNLLYPSNMVHVPGQGLPWEVADAPAGMIHRHFYKSGVVGDHRDYFVYTPPGYDPAARKSYPVLYLLHGYSDDASGWTSVGRAHVIMDNLIAQGKAQPMLVVMTLGYGEPNIVKPGVQRTPDMGKRNMEKYRDALFTEVIPAIERDYKVAKDRNSRAIAGLSMGGAETLFTGLNAIDRFAYIGAFSFGGLSDNFAETFPNLDSKSAAQLRTLYIACGVDDRLIGINRKFVEWLKSKQIEPTWVELPGAHTWMVWRRNLAAFAPLLFQQGKTQKTKSQSGSEAGRAGGY